MRAPKTNNQKRRYVVHRLILSAGRAMTAQTVDDRIAAYRWTVAWGDAALAHCIPANRVAQISCSAQFPPLARGRGISSHNLTDYNDKICMQLSEVIATGMLASRRGHDVARSDAVAASAALPSLLGLSFKASARLLTRHALLLCSSQSAGISVFDKGGNEELTWISVAGLLADFEGRRYPRRHSLCGVSFDSRAIELFVQPHRYFQWMQLARIVINEALVCPIFSPSGKLYGTIWVMSHDDDSIHFEEADARVLMQLAAVAGDAIRAEAIREPGQ